ncbi:MAG: hypothetical protein BM564_03550 [Bacteroidetes bacterium MedPE-SWsnd-G2]|nr:MAG: hypothetical protein BM564_03550 [Bacteroidetes bacterium MedPE-SWsnd-G2]
MSITKKSLILSLFFLLILQLDASLTAQTFTNIQSVSGIETSHNNGIAVADFDNDNDLDVFVVAKAKDSPDNPQSLSKLYKNNNNGTFTDVTASSGLVNLLPEAENPSESFLGLDGFKHGVSWGDYDNDGYPDLFLTHSYKVQLFRNLGDGTFEEVTVDAGFGENNSCRNTGATWFDYNNDGFLDIYINDWDECPTNSLYQNNTDGTFTNVTESTAIGTPDMASYTAFPFDFNSDGFMDLLVTNDFSDPNDVLINQNAEMFSEEGSIYGFSTGADDMGVAISDFNGDGNFDFFITAIDKNFLYQNNGDNSFTDEAQIHGLDNTLWSWGARFADFDLDSDEDLVVVNGYVFEERSTEKNFYFKNLFQEGQNTFEDISGTLGIDLSTISVEVIDVDYDNDGDLDLIITNSNSPVIFYENKLLNFDEDPSHSWLKVKLEGTTSNRDAIGAILVLETSIGVLKRYYSGVGFLSQSLQPVHFGINQDAEVNSLTIKWPSGLTEVISDITANTTIKVIEGNGSETLSILPSQKIYGCLDPTSCSYNPEATVSDGSCTYLEANTIQGDSQVAFLSNSIYTYPLSEDAVANWQVSNGEIIEGQGTNTVTIKWQLEESGTISVRENNGTCYSLPQDLQVTITGENLPENISVARLWNEALLDAIRSDYARPTVHARNLFHTSIALYDAWAFYDDKAQTYLIGNTLNEYTNALETDFIPSESIEESRKKAMSFAAYRILSHRFQNSPNAERTLEKLDFLMNQLGYDTSYTPTLYQYGNAAALGNYIAASVLAYGDLDQSREATAYDNAFYEAVNMPLAPTISGNPTITNVNRWQPLSLDTFIDQSGNLIEGSTPEFLSPEWGAVWGFALEDTNKSVFQRDGNNYQVFHDPGQPPLLGDEFSLESNEAYKWGFSLVSIWGAHLDPSDNVMWDISPASLGNINPVNFPTNYSDYPSFYNLINGGDISSGRALNPSTNQAYETQLVPRGDYARVLAEFWADGPDSETPPGHWFTLLNYINDNPLLEKRLNGNGAILPTLEWDVKSYFILGGTMHDAAISAWGIKGWYDYLRPISAIRYMADLGQSSDAELPSYHPQGITLLPGYIELVTENDPLVGMNGQHLNKIKVYSWKGPDYIEDPETDLAGVDWILAENWWPYQRPSFVTPPFAGYVSGHSTYSRAAAEALTLLTGDEYFPGGMGEFVAKKNEFLVFEEGPSTDIHLQWATYRDASDQCSLSRIWGGIHPPADDIPGRLIGEQIGVNAYNFAVPYFNSDPVLETENSTMYPNPVGDFKVNVSNSNALEEFALYDISGRFITALYHDFNELSGISNIELPQTLNTGIYILKSSEDAFLLSIK